MRPFALAILCSLTAAVAKEPTEILQLRDLYHEHVEEVIAPLKESFLKELDTLEKRLADTRKLDQALYVREQRTRLALDDGFEPIEIKDEEKHREFANLCRVYEKHRNSRIQPLEVKYVEGLRKLERRFIKERRLEDAKIARDEVAEIRGTAPAVVTAKDPKGNVALASKGAKGKAQHNGERLIDGVASGREFAWGDWPCKFDVELAEVYTISQINLYLNVQGGHAYRYSIELSVDGKTWKEVVPAAKEGKNGHRQHHFDGLPAKLIRLKGIENKGNERFHVVELSAQ